MRRAILALAVLAMVAGFAGQVQADGFKTIVKNKLAFLVNESINKDSTSVAAVFLASDTTDWTDLRKFTFPNLTVASMAYVSLWIDFQGSSGDSFTVITQYSPDKTDLAALSTVNVVGATPQVIGVIDYDVETTEAAWGAAFVRHIISHNDGSTQATRRLDARHVLVVDGSSRR